MKISTSILSIKENVENNIKKLGETSTDYIHLDVMDGIFVENKTDFIQIKEAIIETNKPLDVHLMVSDVEKYIDDYLIFDPEYITFHLEVDNDINYLINKIRPYAKVGISIKPNTSVEELEPYLKDIDLVLIMSVEPGRGGQKFIEDSTLKVEKLKSLKKIYDFEIAIDGGINIDNIMKVNDCDIVIVGSYITNTDDYEKQIKNLF